jgi:hypothetical protein
LEVSYANFDEKYVTVNVAFKMQLRRVKRGIFKAKLDV